MTTFEKILLGAFILTAAGLVIHGTINESRNEATGLTEANLNDSEEIQKKLDVSKQEAEELKREIAALKSQPPSVTYYVTAPTVSEAADKVKETVDTSDSDKTAVVPNETEQKVDVYKINLRNNHKVKAGISYVDDNAYLSAGYQAGKVECLVHLDGKGVQGASVLYTIKEW